MGEQRLEAEGVRGGGAARRGPRIPRLRRHGWLRVAAPGPAAEALPRFEEALAQNPDPGEVASIYIHMASCEKDLERYHAALENLEMAELYNKDLKELHNLRGFCCYRLKRHAEAVSAFERAIELDPGSAIDYANIGVNLREMGHLPEALVCFRSALELDPDLALARDNIERIQKALAEQAPQGGARGKKKAR